MTPFRYRKSNRWQHKQTPSRRGQ